MRWRLPARTAEKTCFRTQITWLPPRVLVSQGTDHDQTWGAYDLLNVESSLPILSAVGDLCLEVSLGTWVSRLGRGGLTQFCTSINFCDTEHEVKLGSEDSNLSGAYPLQVWWWPVSCEARNHGSGEVRKARFFLQLCRQRAEVTHHYRRHSSRVSVRWREILFRFPFSGTIIVGLTTEFVSLG